MHRFIALALVALTVPTLATAHDGHDDDCPPQDTALLEIAPVTIREGEILVATERYYIRADADIRVETNTWAGLQQTDGVCLVTINGIVQFDAHGQPITHRWVADQTFLGYYLP
ncbi:MAG TPA: hypothetical protein VM889_02095 [Candidatus Thermoplasmatota archaeon]|nr:hypothetical protein [Candidatus Thermoplasmatota archaeon]